MSDKNVVVVGGNDKTAGIISKYLTNNGINSVVVEDVRSAIPISSNGTNVVVVDITSLKGYSTTNEYNFATDKINYLRKHSEKKDLAIYAITDNLEQEGSSGNLRFSDKPIVLAELNEFVIQYA